ncbi:MAG: IS4 family transposase, partial [Candidatus Izemoplasmatales bacterium]|nr:IS4 family transposase [Candidatus Izemoplasmatales bacterium]
MNKLFNINKLLYNEIRTPMFLSLAKGKNIKSFTRKRKVNPKDIALYLLNKRGMSQKMEIELFNDIGDYDISSPGMLKQRNKFNPQAIVYLNNRLINNFYKNNNKDLKTWKGFILCAIDGSEFEVPNTKESKELFKRSKNQYANRGAVRSKISNAFDILNEYILDTSIGECKANERKLAIKNYESIKKKIKDYNLLTLMDRGYQGVYTMFRFSRNKDKYIIRLYSKTFKSVLSKENDQIVDFSHAKDKALYNAVYRNKTAHNDFKNFMMNQTDEFKTRVVKIRLNTGEIEYLATNLSKDEASVDELSDLYNLRWKIETNFHHLKESMKIEKISSSKKNLIYQDIYSQMLVFNILRENIRESEKIIKQENYKYEMKINFNMAIGLFKKYFIYVITVDD